MHVEGPEAIATSLERVSKPGLGIRGQTPRLPRSLRSLAMTGCDKVLVSRPLRAKSANAVIARKRSDEAISVPFRSAEGLETDCTVQMAPNPMTVSF